MSPVAPTRNGPRLLVTAGVLETSASRRLVDSGFEWEDICGLAGALGLVMCGACHEPYVPKRSDGRYCSNACRQKAYRQRREPRLR